MDLLDGMSDHPADSDTDKEMAVNEQSRHKRPRTGPGMTRTSAFRTQACIISGICSEPCWHTIRSMSGKGSGLCVK